MVTKALTAAINGAFAAATELATALAMSAIAEVDAAIILDGGGVGAVPESAEAPDMMLLKVLAGKGIGGTAEGVDCAAGLSRC